MSLGELRIEGYANLDGMGFTPLGRSNPHLERVSARLYLPNQAFILLTT